MSSINPTLLFTFVEYLEKSRDRRFRSVSAVATSSLERRQIRSIVVIDPFIQNYDPSRASTI